MHAGLGILRTRGCWRKSGPYVTALPSYGYRRVSALLRRDRQQVGMPSINHKRVYRVISEHRLLIGQGFVATGVGMTVRGPSIAVMSVDVPTALSSAAIMARALRMTFALDCCDREAIGWAATTGGHSGDVV